MEAAYNGHFEIVKLLIKNNADVNIQDEVFLIFIMIMIYVHLFIILFLFFFFINFFF
jgi:hypothetical protein